MISTSHNILRIEYLLVFTVVGIIRNEVKWRNSKYGTSTLLYYHMVVQVAIIAIYVYSVRVIIYLDLFMDA